MPPAGVEPGTGLGTGLTIIISPAIIEGAGCGEIPNATPTSSTAAPSSKCVTSLSALGACPFTSPQRVGAHTGGSHPLAARYSSDRASGYRVGDLRGALWAEGPGP